MQNLIQKYWKKIYRVLVLPLMNQRYIRLPALFESIKNPDTKKLFVVTVAFNDMDLIILQHAALKKYLSDPYEYFVFDNSTDEMKVSNLKEWCLAHDVHYIRLPYNHYRKSIPNASHSFALNWIYRNIILRYKPDRFGVWDCDLYPLHAIEINSHLDKNDTWGIIRIQQPVLRPWRSNMHIWVGFDFFRLEKFRHNAPNFMPLFGADVGCRIELKPEIAKQFTDKQYLHDLKQIEITPQVRIEKNEHFIHFGGSADFPPGLAIKKEMMAKQLNIRWSP